MSYIIIKPARVFAVVAYSPFWRKLNSLALKRFRPSAFKDKLKKFQANFEQRTSTGAKWDNDADAASRSNMHVDTDKGFDFNKERLQTNTSSTTTNN